MIIRATERDEEELKVRADRAPPGATRIIGRREEAKADMVRAAVCIFGFVRVYERIMIGES
jgi:hypothetical protein